MDSFDPNHPHPRGHPPGRSATGSGCDLFHPLRHCLRGGGHNQGHDLGAGDQLQPACLFQFGAVFHAGVLARCGGLWLAGACGFGNQRAQSGDGGGARALGQPSAAGAQAPGPRAVERRQFCRLPNGLQGRLAGYGPAAWQRVGALGGVEFGRGGLREAASVAVAIAVMALARKSIWAMGAGMICAAGWAYLAG